MRGVTKGEVYTLEVIVFQSTLPMRGVTILILRKVDDVEFQSTLPMRGVTLVSMLIPGSEAISIHTPHAGSDLASVYYSNRNSHFNPHSPCGE